MKFTPTIIPEVILIQSKVFGDERGFFMETYQAQKFAQASIPHDFVQDNHSGSQRGILRGLHYQINQLADMVADIAGIKIIKKHVPGPQGVRGRNSDNTRLRQVLEWVPEISLEEGLARTYAWIEKQVQFKLEDEIRLPKLAVV